MGAGIAQVAVTHGHPVILVDTSPAVVANARSGISKALDREVEKGRTTAEARTSSLERLTAVAVPAGADLLALASAGLVIEAIIEDLRAKRDVFLRLEAVLPESTVLASNTSSLSITAIASGCRRPERVVGIHFFNPVPLMPLVEIVPGLATEASVTTAARSLVDGWQKTTVLAKDTPGFIVNRLARPFYGESLRIYEEGVADQATIDWAMREIGRFRMGPFELMDLIGNDINFAVTQSVFEAFFYDPRYRPSLTQKRHVEAGLLGRKSGQGYYDYRAGAVRPEPTKNSELGQRIVDRVVAMLINEAAEALFMGLATAEDLDLAMTQGVNYPKGLLRWADEIGVSTVHRRLQALQEEYGEDRYRPSPLLRRMSQEGRRFYHA